MQWAPDPTDLWAPDYAITPLDWLWEPEITAELSKSTTRGITRPIDTRGLYGASAAAYACVS
jgi:hypothetical protein